MLRGAREREREKTKIILVRRSIGRSLATMKSIEGSFFSILLEQRLRSVKVHSLFRSPRYNV